MDKKSGLFSKQAAAYNRYRPTYPKALYEYIIQYCPKREKAWDCGTGNGQVAVVLAEFFEKVIATDISREQVSLAPQGDNITYKVVPAENSGIDTGAVDLVTVAQAIHWFNHEAFTREVKRVLKPGGIIAIWGYGLPKVKPTIQKPFLHFYENTVGPYWHPARAYIDNEYRDIPFDFDEIPVNRDFEIRLRWTLDHFRGYLASWSSVQAYKEKEGKDPVNPFIEKLRADWQQSELLVFPVFLLLGKI